MNKNPEDPDVVDEIKVDEPNSPQVDVKASTAEYYQAEKDLRNMVNSVQAEEQQQTFNLASLLEANVRALDEAQVKRKKMGLVFKNLTVVGEGADATSIATILSPIEHAISFINPLNWIRHAKRGGTDFDIVHNITGFCKDGEMLLVLGRPGAGCSTLLRVLSNQRASYKAITGDITYGGIDANDFKQYLGEAIYTAEEDVHYPTLTVRQTLTAALKCKIPHKRIEGETGKVFVDRLLHMLLNMFGLTKQIDTPVGNEWIRGLSGGERKRLTIAEAMTARSAVNCWDCTTRGLDAASALDYTRSLRVMSNTLHKTNVATFYQASEDMYSLFDKVLVLDKGICVYFGPADTAKRYFEDLGFMCEQRKSTPDFLTGITNPNERKIREGFEDRVPQTAAQMEQVYLKSQTRAQMMTEMNEYEEKVQQQQPHKDFMTHIKEAKAKGTRTKSVYTTNFWQQLFVLLVREFQLIAGDKAALGGKVFSIVSKSFIYATVFLMMGLNAEGTTARAGAAFTCVLFNSLVSLAELPNSLRGRRMLQKHKTYAMYHPAASHVATVASDIPISLLQTFVFSVCSYWIFGFDSKGDKFFIFWFTLLMISLTMTELFRICGNLASSYFAANQMANVVLVILVGYTGFLIPYGDMHGWFLWFYWINPLAYAYKGLLSNEFKGLIFDCNSSGGIVPSGDSYIDQQYQSCAIAGHREGDGLFVLGENYLRDKFTYKASERAIDIIAVFLFWLLYILLNCLIMELLDLQSGGYTRQVYKKGKAPKQNDANAISVQKDEDLGLKAKEADGFAEATQTTFLWEDMKYTVPVKEGKRLLLDNVDGWIKPGQMTALMGSSGAGKTTLLDVLAQRKTIGEIEGAILLNGEPLKKDFERLTGYVEQMDVANPGLTVREALRFSAKMRQDSSVSLADKYSYVEKVLSMMEMTHLGDALIGDLESGEGISVEERKRLTIGLELVGKPKILFLDEPTSGLDAQSSYNIVKFIRKLADSGMPLVCTIHQPSSILFEYFDRLLLLARGGKTVYFGDIGKNSHTLTSYFERNGADPCTPEENPAEYILKAIGAGVQAKQTQDWAATWKASPEFQEVRRELDAMRATGAVGRPREVKEFATGQIYQFWQVYLRLNLIWWRDPTYNWGRLLNSIFVALVNGFTYWNLGNNLGSMSLRVYSVFQVMLLGKGLILLAQPMFMKQRQYFRREYASKFYGWWQFAVSMVLVELPYLAITACIFVMASYWTANLESTAIRGFYYVLAFIVFMFFCVSFGQVVASFCATLAQVAVLNPFFTPFLLMFAGLVQTPKQMPGFWRSWMYPLDPYHYFLEGVVTDVLYEVPVVCNSKELISVTLNPNFTNCGEYFSEFFKTAAGYIVDSASTTVCEYCEVSNGQEFANNLSWSYGNRWRNYGLLWGYFSFNVCLMIFFVYLFRKPRR